VVLVIVVSGVIRDLADVGREREDVKSDVAAALGATEGISDADAKVLELLSEQMQAYNAAELPVVNTYFDPTVGAAEWVEGVQVHLDDMRAAIDEVEDYIFLLEDDGLRTTFSELPELLMDEYLAFVALQRAVSRLDVAGEKAALKEVRASSRARTQYGKELLTKLRDTLPDDVLKELLESQ
jgi:hypothetical protein